MSEWRAGDLALCVNDRRRSWRGAFYVRRGVIYTVATVGVDHCGVWLDLAEDPVPYAQCGKGWEPSRFRKVTPPAADQFDLEVIEAMKPVHELLAMTPVKNGGVG